MELAKKSSSIAVRPKRKIRKDILQENIAGWLFLSLNLIGYVIFKLVPIIISLIFSFSDWNLVSGLKGIKFVGLKNYVNLWTDVIFIKSLVNTIVFAAITVPCSVFLALILAVILNDKIFFKSLVRLGFYLPNIASMVAISVVWSILYMPTFGPINMVLRAIGIENPPGWLSSSQWALPSIIIMSVWQAVGYNAIILLAGLQSVPGSLYESADIDGAGPLSKFFKITIPMLSPTLFFVTIISIIGSFQVFTQVNVMTQGGPGTSTSVLVYYIYKSAFMYNKIGYANAIGWVLFVMVFIFTALQWKFSNKDSHIN
ncbi:multiple sugar transport system permease protein [Paenibacillus sp. 1_12]|uniref:carbohydrate ABC transporter permease n=1 Tax=Paenibacillus sp. 1_12 TaxID=1566278 RepID=UPI0008EB72A5|nr:sugar ABC transporter permease [Paenibacillus sp. 1_12]SFL01295.1 multiple sugar transport system permease protein [Paenibacillus sp. 1_12]